MIGLLTVIVIGALVLTIGIAASALGQSQLMLAGYADREDIARTLAIACLEESAYRLKLNSAYAGGTVPIGTDTCSVTVSGTGGTRTLTAAATLEGHTKTLTATATLKQNAALTAKAWSITAWSENDPP
ncbi:MAG TPA: hypothetical protein VL500_03150 [Candidatus Eisenbacteria bacterium]|nr:hypothetical protein [Candidatus Eisenbacteria bacterium]